MPGEALDDFELSWCQDIRSDPLWRPLSNRENSSNEIFTKTLWTDRTIRAFLSFYKQPPDGHLTGGEVRWLLSLRSGLDGWKGVCHGGILMLIFDDIMHELASQELKLDNVTVTFASSFKRPVNTPAVVLCRAWMGKAPQGRKFWVKSTIGDGKGGIYASAEGFFLTLKGSL